MLKRFVNVAIAVRDIEDTLRLYEDLFGLKASERRTMADVGIKTAMIPVGDFGIELMEPLETEQVLRKFLDAKGEGIYRLAFEVEDMEATLRHLEEKRVPYNTVEIKLEAGPTKVAFIHPRAAKGVMIELIPASRGMA